MFHFLLLLLGLAVFALSFLVVLNSSEQTSRLYPGSNVRFLASVPSALLLIVIFPWLITIPPNVDWLKWLAFGLVVVAHIWYSSWVDARFRGGLLKRALKAQVVDKTGKPITFKRAVWRNIFKLLLFPLAPLSLFWMMKDFRRQAFHDKLSGSFVMWTPEAIREMQPESSYQVHIQ